MATSVGRSRCLGRRQVGWLGHRTRAVPGGGEMIFAVLIAVLIFMALFAFMVWAIANSKD